MQRQSKECFETRKKLGVEEVDNWAKGMARKVMPRNLGAGLKDGVVPAKRAEVDESLC